MKNFILWDFIGQFPVIKGKLPVLIVQSIMLYFSVEFHGVGLEYIEEFEDLFKSHGQGFNAIKSRVKKEQISPKLFRNQLHP